jgi:hypothetical protein
MTTLTENEHAPGADASALLRTAVGYATAPVRFVGFWIAVTVPLAYPPLLYGGLPGPQARVFAVLLVLNCVGLVVGRGYGRDGDAEPDPT